MKFGTSNLEDLSVTNAKLAADIKIGTLGGLMTAERASIVGAINEIESLLADLDAVKEAIEEAPVADPIGGGDYEFTLLHMPIAGTVRVFDGLRLKADEDYTILGAVITTQHSSILVDYKYVEEMS